MPTASKSTQNPKLQKCEPCQAKLKFQEAYRAIRAVKTAIFGNANVQQNCDAILALYSMIDAMPYRKAVYFECAKEARSGRKHSHSFENLSLKSRRRFRAARGRGVMKGMMPEFALIQREEEACF